MGRSRRSKHRCRSRSVECSPNSLSSPRKRKHSSVKLTNGERHERRRDKGKYSRSNCKRQRTRSRSSKSSKSYVSSEESFKSYKSGPRADADNHLVYRTGDTIHGRYQILDTIGEGTFGKVLLCRDKEEKVALKVIKRVDKYFRSAKIEINVLKEILKKDSKLRHRCVRMLDHFDYHGFMCLSFEYLGTSVYEFLKGNNYNPYPMSHVKAISYQLIDAVAFLHNIGVVHTDLKPENILFVSSDSDLYYNTTMDRDEKILRSPEIRLIDFGSATYFEDSHSTIVSTRHYRALEVILELGWDEKCDNWSVGGIMFELYTGDALFQTHDNFEHLAMMKYILGDFPEDMIKRTKKRKYFRRGDLDWDYDEDSTSNCRIKSMCRPLRDCMIRKTDQDHINLFELVERLLNYDPEKRVSMRRCLKHTFFDSIREIYQVR
ncbi:dual specificity protein kinase CLK2-like [Convolutriloba macropyga]|uniref:dual specificity protein kinase CLK2-like n=1 Tax=Convolutriloba macropyga TaxID=536237 RepID=UPI003F51E094